MGNRAFYYMLTRLTVVLLLPMQNDGALGFGADQYSFFGGLGPRSNLEGALEVCC